MEISKNVDLKAFSTFGVPAVASRFTVVNSINDWRELIGQNDLPDLILGGGSNILFVGEQQRFVVKNNIKGKLLVHEMDDSVIVEAGSGELWHDFVVWSLEQGYGGLENLSLIPGTVGAAPIQNIGAYGVEQQDLFEWLIYFDLETGALHRLEKEACRFGYRDSIFKNELKGKVAIINVAYRLTKKGHQVHTHYGLIQQRLAEKNITHPTPLDIHHIIVEIRKEKLPDPIKIGNAGSFFKNPVISIEQFDTLKTSFPDMPHYPQKDGVKIPAAWLIESCGWKGYQRGDVGVSAAHALVLVNYGKALGREIEELAKAIALSVSDKFGVQLTPEVTFI